MLHIVEEFVHGITHLDSRAWRSLPQLAFRPGTLTRNYVMGQRARYVPPFAMFLFSVFAMFLAFALSGGPGFIKVNAADRNGLVQEARGAVKQQEAEVTFTRKDVTDAEAEVSALQDNPSRDPAEFSAAQAELAAARAALKDEEAALSKARGEVVKLAAKASQTPAPTKEAARNDGPIVTVNNDVNREEALREIAQERERLQKAGDSVGLAALSGAEALVKSAPDGNLEINDAGSAGGAPFMDAVKAAMAKGDFIRTPWPAINEKLKKKTANPDLFLYKLQNTAYKFSFLLIPLSLPFLWLMFFWKKGVTLYDHAVFALYSLSFVSFVFLTISLLAHWVPASTTLGYAFFLFPVHLFFHFKGAYALGWFSTTWRTVLFCTVFAWLTLTAFLIVIVGLGVAG
jgi:Protein of unknown function (DUF3667)